MIEKFRALTSELVIQIRRPKDWMGVILLVALINGLIYTFAILPWWHYDEPGHFEYAWLVVHKNPVPGYSDIDESMRRSLSNSLEEWRYYEFQSKKFRPNDVDPVWIGIPQIDNLPLYYWYVSIPLRFLSRADWAVQNIAARLATLLLFLATLWLTWKILDRILPEAQPLRWMVPLFMALLPPFVELMTSISDDAGATFIFTLFTLFAVNLLQRGVNLVDVVGLGISTVFCMFTKTTVWAALPLALLVILFVPFRQRLKWIPWVVILTGMVVLLLTTVRWGDAAYWFPVYSERETTRGLSTQAVDGNQVLQYSPQNESIVQLIPGPVVKSLHKQKVTLGAWMWAEQPIEALPPLLILSNPGSLPYTYTAAPVTLTTQPQFYSFSVEVQDDSGNGWIYLTPYLPNEPGKPKVFYDGIVFVAGEFSNTPPTMQGAKIEWDGQVVSNLARNGSAEKAWFGSAIEKNFGVVKIHIFNWSATLASMQDRVGAGWILQRSMEQVFQTFWGQLAKNFVPMLGGNATYLLLGLITLLAAPGVLISGWMQRKALHWPTTFVLGVIVVLMWTQTFIRATSEIQNTLTLIIPYARYAAPAMAGTTLLLCAGWLEIFSKLKKLGNPWYREGAALFIAFATGLNLFSLISVINFFHIPDGKVFSLFFVLTIMAAFFAILTLKLSVKQKER